MNNREEQIKKIAESEWGKSFIKNYNDRVAEMMGIKGYIELVQKHNGNQKAAMKEYIQLKSTNK